jgi:hypothetical protein
MGKGLLVIILGGIVIFGWINFNNNNRVTKGTELAARRYSDIKARNICNSATEMLLTELAKDNSYRTSGEVTKDWYDGEIIYTIEDTVVSSDSLVKINVTSNYLGSVKSTNAIVWIPSSGFNPELIKGVINTNNSVNALGNLIIDGRNHDYNGNLIANKGKYGVWTTGSYSQAGGCNIGGTDDTNIDHIPSTPGDPSIIKQNQTWSGTYPNSPDKVMGGVEYGFPEGKLKSIAQSGVNGSQYVTNPTSLSYPLKGITYVEAAQWLPATIDGTGILIAHNSTLSTIVKNLQGTFKGLIIVDDVDQFKGILIGALVVLSPAPASGNCIGNGTGDLLYSSESVKFATKNVEKIESGFGKHRVKIVSWLE